MRWDGGGVEGTWEDETWHGKWECSWDQTREVGAREVEA